MMRYSLRRFWFFYLVCFAPSLSRIQAEEKVEFNRDIRPILSDNCFFCHGPDKNKRQAKLRLDDREIAIEKGAITPGKPKESELINRIVHADDELIMPPPESNKKLTAKQKDLLKKWIEQGAEYQPHWAYIPPNRFPVPEVQNKTWIKTPIDAFILAKLEARKIQPSPPADKRTLVRRLYLDLIGLPPTPEQVEAFCQDPAPNAYEKLVDQMLASPHYGERMAVPWLDLVRFADTVGYHGDQNQRIFPYRDYVIDSFNQNKPYDQFTLEQIAGDLLPNATQEHLIATGFHRLNMMTREGGAQPKEYLAKYQADRVRTVSMTWLGSTMGCAECHDHKYDPFTAKDFYAMSAFFADLKQWGVYNDYNYTPNPDLKGWSNDHPFPPEIEVPSPYLMRRMKQIEAKMQNLFTQFELKKHTCQCWKTFVNYDPKTSPDGWNTIQPQLIKPDDGIQVLQDGRVLIHKKPVKGEEIRLRLPNTFDSVAAIRLELLPHEKHQGSILRSGTSSTINLSASLRTHKDKETKLNFYLADADKKDDRYASTEAMLGILGGWKTASAYGKEPQTAVYLLDSPVRIDEESSVEITIKADHLGCFRLSVSPFSYLDPRQPVLPQEVKQALLSDKESARKTLAGMYVLSMGLPKELFATYKTLHREWLECRYGKAFTQVAVSTKPMETRLLPRGNWMDESGPVLQPAVPSFLPQPTAKKGENLNRLDLAKWIMAKENPLTARVFVNRQWKQLFGTGFSSIVEDLGAQGEWPTHPELLDWLAVEFRESGWDIKRLIKQMVLSNTYQQDSKTRTELKDIDPNNRLFAFMSPRRLEAEFVRDNALAIAGLLNQEMGGPSIKPYQPGGYYANLQFPDRDYKANLDDRQYRRGVYMHWQRTFLHPTLANFDAPSREECTANRIVANTPQQALTLLNDPSFVEAARVLAQRLLTSNQSSDADRIDQLFHRSLARAVKPKERDSLLKFLQTQRESYRNTPDDAKKLLKVGIAPVEDKLDPNELAAWTSLCRVVLNLHETITRY